jgi:hypothetical protein
MVSTISSQPPMIANELRRQADVLTDLVEFPLRVLPPSAIQPDKRCQDMFVSAGLLVARLTGGEFVPFRSDLRVEERSGRLVIDGGCRRHPAAKNAPGLSAEQIETPAFLLAPASRSSDRAPALRISLSGR